MINVSLHSTVGIAKIGTNSLRATIPEGIVAYLNIESGDKLEWIMEVSDGEKIVIMSKANHVNKKTAKTGYQYKKSKSVRQ